MSNTSLTREQIDEFKSSFDLFKSQTTGELSIKELEKVLRSLGIRLSKDELVQIINMTDIDNDGTISFEEFLELMDMKMHQEVDIVQDCFNAIDKGHDGFIDAADLRAVFEMLGDKLSPSDISTLIRHADPSGSGRVSFEQFQELVNTLDLDM
eukprot:TRINITY_DN342_c0_g1_i1.p1 TRINITY_DN342_c0_g1~~TRINITY_DN342_c0_g1_i1.p1  ORF type:complete len:153 (-),score=48.22 TRINITY_DN342_c0_g1_i1:29-487(-)